MIESLPLEEKHWKGVEAMKIAICDDLQAEREKLQAQVALYLAENELQGNFFEFSCGEDLLKSEEAFDLIFLDIYMDGITGIETARQLKEKAPDCLIVFTTTSIEHGADAFEVDAFHYLVKPIDPAKLQTVLRRWLNLLSEIHMVEIKSGRGNRKVPVRDILYVEVQGRSCCVHTVSEEIAASMTLSALEELLPADQFVKPIRYCLAALRHIRRVSEDFLELEDGTRIKTARGSTDSLRQTLSSYRLRQLRRR